MTLRDYAKVFRHRWAVIAASTIIAALVMFLVTPAYTDTTQKVGSYTATATLLVGGPGDAAGTAQASLGRIALFVTSGEIPKRAAESLGYEGDPSLLASGLTVEQDPSAQALTITAAASDGDRAAAVANAFANEAVGYFGESDSGVGDATVSVLQEASPIPNNPGGGFVVPPSRPARTAIAAVLGLMLGLALALVLHHLDSRLRTRDEVHEALRVPIVAEVPMLSRAQRSPGRIAVIDQPLGIHADGYRAARSALTHIPSHRVPGEWSPQSRKGIDAAVAESPRVVLVTSGHAGEGKTTTIANLAASFAEAGQQVLVLDADLRSPDVHQHFDVPQAEGISNYLGSPGDYSVDSLVRPTSVRGVWVITAGTRLDRPTSLVSRLGPLLDAARGRADVVLVDSAPLLAASDVFDILPMVDTVLLVVRSGRLTEASGARVAELLGRFQVPVVGAALIGAPVNRSDGYGYGYGYGYGEPKKRGRFGRRKAASPVPEQSPSTQPAQVSSEAEQPPPESRRERRTS